MREISVNQELIFARLEEILRDIEELRCFQKISLEEFKRGKNFAIAEHYLRRALEAIFDIGSHILSRIPGVRPSSYKEIALLLGENEIVKEEFARDKLLKMAGYRNRLVHFYLEVKKDELYSIIKNNLSDIEEFCKFIKSFLTSLKG
ncbi:DUF86 domain-containing protein [Candidatus Calescamantes bacterium]|nr:DUF86 domain-containing protein [Candidatus Calescamantes bacterium]